MTSETVTANTISADLETLSVPVDDLHQLPGNPRKGDVDAVAKSLETFGQLKPIVARRDGTIVAGNHTWAAARKLGWDRIAVVWIDVDDSTAQAFALADNRTAELGSYDEELLARLVAEVHSVDPDMLEATGWSGKDLQRLLDVDAGPAALLGDPDDVGEPPVVPLSKPGDVWLLGEHRLICGDSTDPLTAERLLDGGLADCMWTDPPYGVNYVGKTADALTIQNDGAEDLPELLHGFLATATGALQPGAPAYIAHPAGPLQLQFGQAILDAGWSLRQQLVWVKDTFALGRSDYHYSHEPIWLAYTPGGEGRRGRGGDSWFGDNSQRTVLEYPKPKRSELHPTMKPVELVAHMLKNSCPPHGVVYEPFGGSGSTLLAAHMCGMVARLIELDPRYVDVICRRWQNATGVFPVHESTGETVDFEAKR